MNGIRWVFGIVTFADFVVRIGSRGVEVAQNNRFCGVRRIKVDKHSLND
jgi:hypothetical protein